MPAFIWKEWWNRRKSQSGWWLRKHHWHFILTSVGKYRNHKGWDATDYH
jgi:hypothetical protein